MFQSFKWLEKLRLAYRFFIFLTKLDIFKQPIYHSWTHNFCTCCKLIKCSNYFKREENSGKIEISNLVNRINKILKFLTLTIFYHLQYTQKIKNNKEAEALFGSNI
jgi:hypothetical protein